MSATFLIPVTPTPANTLGSVSANVGVTLNGVQLAVPAPVDAILSAYTIAAFDDCGGHVNPVDGYHFHAASAGKNLFIGCFTGKTVESTTGPAGPGGLPPQ